MFFPNREWGAICPKTGKHFNFNETYDIPREATPREKKEWPNYQPKETVYIEKTLRFPEGKLSFVEIVCPSCEDHPYHRFGYGELSRPSHIAQREAEENERETRQMEADAKIAQADIKKWEAKIKQLENQLEKDREYNLKMLHEKDKILDEHLKNLTESYMTLAKFVNDHLGQPTNSRKNPNYEGTNI